MDFNNNIFYRDFNGFLKKDSQKETCDVMKYMFLKSPKREMYKLFFSNSDWETLDSSTQSKLFNIMLIFEISTFVQQKWIEDSLLETIKFLDGLDSQWISILGQITQSCGKHEWAMTKIHIGVYYYNIISICVANNLLQYMNPKKVVSVETLDDQYSCAIGRKIELGLCDEYYGYEINDCVEITMDSYCTNLRKQVMRQLDADFDDFE
jgi:hypothetical protein